jgi:hypothetical protein
MIYTPREIINRRSAGIPRNLGPHANLRIAAIYKKRRNGHKTGAQWA